MADRKTPLTRSLVFTGELSGNYSEEWACPDPNHLQRIKDSKATFSFFWTWGQTSSHILRITGDFNAVSISEWGEDGDGSLNCGVSVTRYKQRKVSALIGSINTDPVEDKSSTPITIYNGASNNGDFTGSWELSISNCEVWFDDQISTDYPDYSGSTKTPDPPFESNIVWKYKIGIGTVLVASVSCGGRSKTLTHTVDANSPLLGATVSNFTLVQYVKCSSIASAGLMASVSKFNNVTLTAPYSGSSSGLTYDATNGAQVTSDGSISSAPAELTAKISPLRNWSLHVNIRAMNQDYPGSVTLSMVKKQGASAADVVTDSTGKVTVTGSQAYYDCSATLNGSGQTPLLLNEEIPLQIWLKDSWLTGAQEPTADWRVGFKGMAYQTFTLSQASERQVCGQYTNAGAARKTIALPDGSTHADLVGSSFYKASLQGYAFLRLRIKSDTAHQSYRVQIGAKRWTKDWQGNNLKTGDANTFVEQDIDLCNPNETTATKDTQDTRFPVSLNPKVVVTDGPLWGVSNLENLVLAGMIPGVNYTLELAKVVRCSASDVTFLPTFDYWIPDGGGSDLRLDFLYAATDGRKSLERTDFYRTPISPGDTYNYTIFTLTNIIDHISGQSGNFPKDGWSVTAAGSFPSDGFHSNSLPACFAYGGGMLYRSNQWNYGFDLDATSSLTVYAQPLWDSITLLPALGDVFGFTSNTDDVVTLRAGKVLRGQVAGVVFNRSERRRWAGITVNLKEDPGGTAAGSGTSNSMGIYWTGTPCGKGNKTYKAELQSGDLPPVSASMTLPPRKRMRVSFFGLPVCCDVVFCTKTFYFPFLPQFSDPDLLPLEEWRRFPGPAQEKDEPQKNEAVMVEG